jgi:four helix bundle protein
MDFYRSFTGQNTGSFRRLYGYKKLLAWQAADEVAAAVHGLVVKFPYTYADLRGQMLKSAGSAADNIAEGYCRNALGDYIRFCEIARGSLGELGSQIQRCERWKLITSDALSGVLALYGDATYHLEQLIKSLRAKRQDGTWDRSLGVSEQSVSYEVFSADDLPSLPDDFPAPDDTNQG